jgi:hypothetical protein
MMDGYPCLFSKFGWKPGIYRSPKGYEHPWLCVTEYGTTGHWSRSEARLEFHLATAGLSPKAITDQLNREAEEDFWAEVSRDFTRKEGK